MYNQSEKKSYISPHNLVQCLLFMGLSNLYSKSKTKQQIKTPQQKLLEKSLIFLATLIHYLLNYPLIQTILAYWLF